MTPSTAQAPSAPIKLRCPKCRRQDDLFVTSLYTEQMGYEVRGGRIVASYLTGALAEYIRSDVVCRSCGHGWRARDESWGDPVEGRAAIAGPSAATGALRGS